MAVPYLQLQKEHRKINIFNTKNVFCQRWIALFYIISCLNWFMVQHSGDEI